MFEHTPAATPHRDFAMNRGIRITRRAGRARSNVAATGALALAASAAFAQSAPETPVETLLVTGTRITAGPDTMPSPTTILTPDELATTNPVSVPEFLRIVPGVQLTQPGGGAGIVSFYLRGCQPNYTLFLVDGVKVTDPNDSRGGSFDLSTLSVGEVDRVEIIRGPQSAIYGADALCGVVNIITRHHYDAWQTQTSAEVGAHQWYDVALGLGGPVMQKGSLVLHAENMDQGSLVDGATYGLSTFDGKLTLDQGTGWRVIGHARYATSHGTDFPDQSGGPQYAATPDRDRRSTNDSQGDLQGLFNLPADWLLNLTASNYHHQADFASPNVYAFPPIPPVVEPPGIPARGELDDLLRQYASGNVVGHILSNLQATAGIDYTYERGSTDGYLIFGIPLPTSYASTRADVGVFAELQYIPVTGLTLSGSTRRDDWREFGTHSTSSLGLVYTPDAEVTTIRFNWGQGFKLPSFWALGNALVGNPNLLPEESRTTELGIARRFLDRRLMLSVTAFDNQFYNEVDYDSAMFKFVNVAEVKGRGGEFEFNWDIDPAYSLYGNATYVAIDAGESHVTIRQRPKWLGNLQGTWRPMEHWSLQATVRSVGQQLDTAVPAQEPVVNPAGAVTLGAYTVVNVSAVWTPTAQTRVTFAVDNLLDKNYSELYGFPEPGVEPRLGIQYRFP